MTLFKKTKIAPEGRNKYGNYSSEQNLTKKVAFSTYAGNISTETTYVPKEPEVGPIIEYLDKSERKPIIMKTTAQAFDGQLSLEEIQSGSTKIVGYSGYNEIAVFVGDLADSGYTNYAISGIPAGMEVVITNNGETGTTLDIFVTSAISQTIGTLYIPCSIAKGGEEGMGNDWGAWNQLYVSGDTYTDILEWNYNVSQNPYPGVGAIVRGPWEWSELDFSSGTRRFSNGEGDLPIDRQYIDVLHKDGDYYVCRTSYYTTPEDIWITVGGNWYPADANYNFIISQLIVADNAKVNTLTNNALILCDSGGTVSGGAQGGSGSTAAFWAGAANPEDANFMVSHDGTIRAENGIFAGYVQNKYVKLSELESGATTVMGTAMTYYVADTRANIIVDSASTVFIETAPSLTSAGYRYRTLKLPHACEELNGFTYRIVVPGFTDPPVKATGALSTNTDKYTGRLRARVALPDNTGAIPSSDAEAMYDVIRYYSGTSLSNDTYAAQVFTFNFGTYELTCLPINGIWAWTLVDGTVVMEAKAGDDEIISYKSTIRWA